ncbi:hypothetical protein [Budvicia diplopodorum]|uniref:hypothetical protein n=1 Tax=Budvicia diplopodorum TaxID=1119056 RepID=UPI00135ABAC5|nr:hypothetical protein [Budvicia diplopodorum]
MRELSVFEMNEIAGGYSWSFSSFGGFIQSTLSNVAEAAASAVLGAAAGGVAGAIIGGANGGDGGGLLGFGQIGQLVGMIGGGLIGVVGVGVAATVVGWDITLDQTIKAAEGITNGSFRPW